MLEEIIQRKKKRKENIKKQSLPSKSSQKYMGPFSKSLMMKRTSSSSILYLNLVPLLLSLLFVDSYFSSPPSAFLSSTFSSSYSYSFSPSPSLYSLASLSSSFFVPSISTVSSISCLMITPLFNFGAFLSRLSININNNSNSNYNFHSNSNSGSKKPSRPVSFFVQAQYRSDTKLYKETIEEGLDTLKEHLESLPDLVETYHPMKAFPSIDFYELKEPSSENYKISMILDPCKGTDDKICCQDKYGTPEYYRFTTPDWTYPYRVSARYILDETFILDNVDVVLEDGVKVDIKNQRRGDDEISIDDECEDFGVPYEYCSGFRKKQSKYPLNPICKDNNQSINALNSCWSIDPTTGEAMENEYCIQVAYAQSAFAVLCGNEFANDEHCGTYLEVHLPHGSNYFDREYKISQKKIDSRNSSGFVTTTIPTEFDAESADPKAGNKLVLCNFFEQTIRVNQTVIILDNAERCCCPLVSYQCPKFEYSEGVTASTVKTIEQKLYLADNYEIAPFCYDYPTDKDYVMCEEEDVASGRIFYFRCDFVNATGNATNSHGYLNYTSNDLEYDAYQDQCSFLPECAAAIETQVQSTDDDDDVTYTSTYSCGGTDQIFSFIGMTGTVVSIPDPSLPVKDGLYGVTFNGNRTVYYFKWNQVAQDTLDHNYELWWVQRTRSNYIIQKKKAFQVSEPTCTYDNLRRQYLPYTIIDDNGERVDSIGAVAQMEDDEWRLNDFIDNPNNRPYVNYVP